MSNTTGQTPGIANTASGAAIQRYKIGYHADEWGQRSSTPSGIPDASGSWVRYADHVTALAAGQATAAQAVVQDDLITLRKPTTSAELLWLLKLAHLVISDVDKTLEETFAPAQPAAEASRFGSPELQAMIIARCVEKDQADSVPAVSDLPPLPAPDLRDVGTKPQEIKEFLKGYATEYARTAIAARAPADSVLEDAARWHWIAEYLVGPRTDLDDEIVASETINELRKLVDDDLAARKQGASHDR